MFEGLLQPTHLILILIVGLVVLGPGKAGDLGGQLGRGIRDFKRNMNEGEQLAPSSGGRFCISCGAANDGLAQFCPQCGTKAAAAV